ncbi:hypothetical protein MNEG_6086 [Monoraphidium neglectum]|uniref:Uncharacterized protein n=1 Tax=Monoraphidium neglectum TaxID=145388 RepID=A0A0D2JS83_9CHLO|nr:hypothetical protein MNEG_6086 [Monoraphidium neglectum]KIZ01878.1 hypothetical protein MNEG_6086 [Monoraphidium neglectum]|eukprot:XP_013900897.1 hypothetical protein MNEG_6086 [Monoraphidium neglectum]
MSLTEQLESQLKRLNHASSVFRRQAAVGVFQLLASGAARGSATAAQDAALQCLTARHVEVVDEAVAQLLRLADGAALPALDAAAALRLLLDALDAAPPRTAPPLARGVVSAFLLRQRQSAAGGHVGGGSGGAGPAESSELWARHPLSAALLAQPAGAQQLLSHACDSLVAAAAGDEGSKAVVNTWHALRPFFSFILLRPVETYGGAAAAAHAGSVLAAGASGDARGPGSALALRACLVGKLARAACGSAAMARLAVPFLLRHVACTPLADDAVRRIRGSVWAPWLPELGVLAMGSCDEDRCALFALMAAAMDKVRRHEKQQQRQQQPPLPQQQQQQQQQQQWIPEAALLVVPLLHALVLSPSTESRRWASALLAAAQARGRPWAPPWLEARDSGAASAGAAAAVPLSELCCQGELVVVRAARRLLAPLAGDSARGVAEGAAAVAEAVAWLDALAAAVAHARGEAAAAASGAGAAAFSVALPSARQLREQELAGGPGYGFGAAELGPGASALLGALLTHGDAHVAAAAARCLRELALALPASAPVFLPPLLVQLRRLGAGGGGKGGAAPLSGTPLDVARAQAAMLAVLPAMTSDPTTAAFAMRALQPLAAPSAPPALRGLALRLAVDGWRETGRGWARAEAAVNGYAPPGAGALAAADQSGLGPRAGDLPPVELRLARAAALRQGHPSSWRPCPLCVFADFTLC